MRRWGSAALAAIVASGVAAAGCGRYGPPVRAPREAAAEAASSEAEPPPPSEQPLEERSVDPGDPSLAPDTEF